ncbi:hypothetical protein LJ656_04640 [Paraburkholderia sp. MMS20-SJTR3]|uniref:Uncharacterized protein n=1 Tax=Paraburkholderia sejongensis TaxID=2886946 RepID=A0ABS8JPN8_9BURK|nr:hypothetical protein [Paraburkholderia sp. MMS20-SJTR3]MCC8391868.1 hypothetical protein [Paraburkholderia sp. MMS20-SJTR3]
MSTPFAYTATESSFVWSGNQPRATGLFDARPPTVPRDAKPIYDDELDCIIGYQHEISGVFRIYSLDGRESLSEKPLEAPLIDPFDVLFVVGGIWKAGTWSVTRWGLRGLGSAIGQTTLSGLRTRYRALTRQPIRFAAAPLAHMQNPARHVPVHILRLAMKYGKRSVDPAGHRGVFQYTYPITRNGMPYRPEVVVRESDHTILHFVYRPIR